jgi:hypothetical protein
MNRSLWLNLFNGVADLYHYIKDSDPIKIYYPHRQQCK